MNEYKDEFFIVLLKQIGDFVPIRGVSLVVRTQRESQDYALEGGNGYGR